MTSILHREASADDARRVRRRAAAIALFVAAMTGVAAAECVSAGEPVDTIEREEQAMKAALARVAPSVVRIETFGGLERVDGVLLGTGPTTGLIVSEDGYIISSAFNFAQQPASILIGLADGRRTAARLIATDHSRMLVLLKIKTDAKLPVARAVPVSKMRVGQWAIAVGRTFDGGKPNMSVGIVAALGRIWGKAVQTDAKISPSNYGGPLVDIHGDVLGVLAPLNLEGNSEVQGAGWYDSGIGFAVPLEHVQRVLPRLAKGESLYPGLAGVSLAGSDFNATGPTIAACHPNSPAKQAGLAAGDVIVKAGGREIARYADLLDVLKSAYAGDTVRLVVRRGTKQQEHALDVTLVQELQPQAHPFLGILPRRDPAETGGVAVRFVYPRGPAEKAGVRPGDLLTKIDGTPVANAENAEKLLNTLSPEKTIALELTRDGTTHQLSATLDRLPTDVPTRLPPARRDGPRSEGERPAVGVVNINIPEFKNGCVAYVPHDYDPAVRYGVLLWLHAPRDVSDESLIGQWKSLCDATDVILIAPKAADPKQWDRGELEFVRKTLDDVTAGYHVDPARVVVAGRAAGGTMAYLFAAANRQLVRGVAVVDAPIPLLTRLGDNDPAQRLAFFTTTASSGPSAVRIVAGIKSLRIRKYPVTVLDQGRTGRPLRADEQATLLRWLDTLDRL